MSLATEPPGRAKLPQMAVQDEIIDSRVTEIPLTGNEQATVDRFTGVERKPDTRRFPNSLDNALRVLLARAFPPPQRHQLVEAAVSSMAEACVQRTAKQVFAVRTNNV